MLINFGSNSREGIFSNLDMNKKKIKPMTQLTAGYEKFIKGKEVKKNGKTLFEKTLKKAIKPRDSK